MTFKRNSPGCNASGSCGCSTRICPIGDDDFNRSDNTDIDSGSSCGWTENVGDAEILSNKLKLSGGAFSAPRVNCDAVSDNGEFTLNVDFTKHNANVRILFNYVDSSNFHFVQITATAMTIVQRAGSDTTLDTEVISLSDDVEYHLLVCQYDGMVYAYISGGVSEMASSSVTIPATSTVGLGAVILGSGGYILYDNFDLQYVYENGEFCAGSPCTYTSGCGDACWFDEANADFQFLVDLGAGGLVDENCEFCDEMVGEFTLTNSTGSCFYNYFHGNDTDTACTGFGWNIRLWIFQDVDQCYLRVRVEAESGSDSYYADYETDPGDPSIAQTDGSWTLIKSTGHGNPYRSKTGWFNPGEDWDVGCNGTLPATITVTADYV